MSSASQPTAASQCCKFQAHHLRPEKCRNCFCDASQHSTSAESPTRTDSTGPTAKNTGLKQNVADNSSNSTNPPDNSEHSSANPERNTSTRANVTPSTAAATTATTTTMSTTMTTPKSPIGRSIAPSSSDGECKGCREKQDQIDKLTQEVDQWQKQCQLAEHESQRARDELRSLEDEMEELHDNFKEEESEQFEQVKQELDAALKNCKILQIRLNKSERQYNQLEQVKMMLEKQLEENQQQQQQHRLERDPSLESPATTPLGGHRREQQQRQGSSDFPKLYEMSSPSGDHVRVPTCEYDQLLRDLNDTSERERDLQEQIKYSQEEAQLKGERLQAIEAENEILLGRINKLTLANLSLRSSLLSSSLHQHQHQHHQHQHQAAGSADGQQQQPDGSLEGTVTGGNSTNDKLRDLYEQNEQLKLALEVAAAECQRLKVKLEETQQTLTMRERSLQEATSRLATFARADEDASSDSSKQLSDNMDANGRANHSSPQGGRQELECRQLRARLAHSERECRQLRSQLELLSSTASRNKTQQQQANLDSTNRGSAAGRQSKLFTTPRSQSMEAAPSIDGSLTCNSSAKCQETLRQLDKQCQGLLERNNQLELKLQRLCQFSSQDLDQKTNMESELFDKLRRQLESSESELAKAKSRLVELDIECSRAQRQYKRLLASLDTCGTSGGELQVLRRNRLGSETMRDSMSRQELRQALRDLELDIDDLLALVRAKECLIKEMEQQKSSSTTTGSRSSGDNAEEQHEGGTFEQQVKSLRRLLDQEQLLSNNLKLDVANLERDNMELASRSQLLERERVSMEEELDKLRQLNGEYQAELEESRREKQLAVNKSRELNEQLDRVRFELNQARQQQDYQQQQALAATPSNNSKGNRSPGDAPVVSSSAASTDLLLMARDLSELKVKNGFLIRQLEIAREDTVRQLDELRASSDAQLRRSVELAQIELKERHLQETQQLRDESNEYKQKLASLQRQACRQEEETALERDRARAMERDWRRDKSQWQQVREQLEGQLAIEKRSSEFRLKEAEASIRDKERQLINVQDRCVQLERDLKRMQNKYRLLEEDNESKLKQLTRDLEIKTKELVEISGQKQTREERQYEQLKRLQEEKSTLKETLESIRQSYDEKLIEARQLKELLHSRQEQSYKERSQQFERIEALTRRLNELSELEAQVKLLKQRREIQERQSESSRRDLAQLREERSRLRSRCDELEKRELISKTSSISGNPTTSFFKPFGSPRSQLLGSARATSPPPPQDSTARRSAAQQQATNATDQLTAPTADQAATAATVASDQRQSIIEKLSGKINDQRNLINILRQQLGETQLELKQLKLLQTSERSKWQARVALLTSRLNECEEKLAYETSLLNRSPALLDKLARPRLELAWSQERQANLELIQQQQGQIELLAKDLKKTSQAQDLLRLHAKQLESHNNKLSKKLIEYQQQTHIFSLQDRKLELSYDKLLQRNSKITQEVRPLLDIVAKIVASLDAPDQQQQTRSARLMSDSTDRPLRAGAGLAQQHQRSFDSDDSTDRLDLKPVASKLAVSEHQQQVASSGTSRLARLLAGGSSSSWKPTPSSAFSDSQATGEDKKLKKTTKRVRVKCSTLGITTGEKKQLKEHLKTLGDALSADPASQRQHHVIIRKSTTITTTKSAVAGRTLAGGSQDSNSSATAVGARPLAKTSASNVSYRNSVEPPAVAPDSAYEHSSHSRQTGGQHRSSKPEQEQRSQSHSRVADYETATDQSSQQSSQQTTTSRVHWQLDSDLESDCSWSVAAPATTAEPSSSMRTDTYRRFPQAGPAMRGHSCGPLGGGAGGGASLTDYESESSLASDYSVSTFSPLQGRRPGAPSGAESDSGLAGYTASGSSRKKSSGGLKGRLTSTLRKISRSITAGLGGSDTEESSVQVASRQTKANKDARAANLKEIRV